MVYPPTIDPSLLSQPTFADVPPLMPGAALKDALGEPSLEELGIPAYIFAGAHDLPDLSPPKTINLSNFLILSPSHTLPSILERSIGDNGELLFALPHDFASAMKWQINLLKRGIIARINQKKHHIDPANPIIPKACLDAVEMKVPAIFYSLHIENVTRPLPLDTIVLLFKIIQDDVKSAVVWLEEVMRRVRTTHINDDWSFDPPFDFDSINAHYCIRSSLDQFAREIAQVLVLTEIAKVRAWPRISQWANKLVEDIRERVKRRRENPGVYLDADDEGNIRSYIVADPKIVLSELLHAPPPSSLVSFLIKPKEHSDPSDTSSSSYMSLDSPHPSIPSLTSDDMSLDSFIHVQPPTPPPSVNNHPRPCQTARRSRPWSAPYRPHIPLPDSDEVPVARSERGTRSRANTI
ncbi:hypothetical protein SISSUDRAFT_1067936 [Sistotremastrum suecicum HHB10207 ss-3]|uniref:Uncharacterized protein n=1 Tax=Sistotremastrum suecicum HHB10207 ss-3 TaxID=1314776 RepID=A0A165WJS9_9AGAM|nr:hypothetical protein SISSUDRAFT_1067936 [Sistotremastrum suecicum HHB10207 ss-3]